MMEESDCVSSFFGISEPHPATSQDITDTLSNTSQTSMESVSDSLGLSQLTIDEPIPILIQPFYNITPREMPESPHDVIEEEFKSNPWAMLIATIFLTKTSGKNARPHMKTFFEEYPTPYDVLGDNPNSLERFFENLGLRKRGYMIWRLSYQYISSKWRRATDLCGIGKYGEDAFRIFCLGHLDVEPDDRYLRLYVDWLRQHTDIMEDSGIIDSECVIEDPVLKYYNITLRNG